MQYLDFTYNWNGKLYCDYFCSLRFSGTYKLGTKVMVRIIKGKTATDLGLATIEQVKKMNTDSITPFIAGVETGYSVQDCKKIIFKMLGNVPVYCYLLLVRSDNGSPLRKAIESKNSPQLDFNNG